MAKKIHAYAMNSKSYTEEDSEILIAVQRLKEKQRIKRPQVTDIIAVMRGLGWRKIA